MKTLKTFESYSESKDKKILTTYEKIIPEEDGRETGFYDEEGESMIPDSFDEEGVTVVDKSVEFLRKHYAHETSGSHFNKGVWYTTTEPDVNYSSGEDTYYSYHLDGFTEDEEFEIFKIMTDYEEKQFKKSIKKYNL